MDVPLLNALPRDYQQENWLLDPASYWEMIRRIGRQELSEFTDPVELLWTNGYSTFNGLNDQIPASIALTLRESLSFISVSNLTLWVFAPGEAFGNSKRRVQGRFHHNDVEYWLWVTDPDYERRFLQRPDDNYSIGDAFLTISLGEPYRGNSCKLIAAIILP